MTPYLGSVATCQRDALGGADGSGNALVAGDALSHETIQLKPLRLIPRYLESYQAPLICDLIMRHSEHFDATAIDHFFNQSSVVVREQSRMGYRLEGQTCISARRPRYSMPIPLGGVQIHLLVNRSF